MMRAVAVCIIVVAAAGSSSCTAKSSTSVPASLISPATRTELRCLQMPGDRAASAQPDMMLTLLDGHLPQGLPAGFGLVRVDDGRGLGSGMPTGAALWVDPSCRTVSIAVWPRSDPVGPGPRVGRFTLTSTSSASVPTCMRPGPSPCLAYRAPLFPGVIEVDIVGMDRSGADAIVRSIP